MTTGQALAPTIEWIVHTRPEDNELLGFLVPEGELFLPVTVFGYVLSGPVDRGEAAQVLESIGLSYLAERWWLRLDDTTTIAVEIVEASPNRVVVKNVDFYAGDYGHRYTLRAPIGENRLTMRDERERDAG